MNNMPDTNDEKVLYHDTEKSIILNKSSNIIKVKQNEKTVFLNGGRIVIHSSDNIFEVSKNDQYMIIK